MKGLSRESKPARVSARRAKQDGNPRLRHVCGAGRNPRWVRRVCWQLGDPSDGGRADLASSSLFSGRLPCDAPGGGRASPHCGEPPTGEPCAGDPHARFGGRGGRVNRSFLPLTVRGWTLPCGGGETAKHVHGAMDGAVLRRERLRPGPSVGPIALWIAAGSVGCVCVASGGLVEGVDAWANFKRMVQIMANGGFGRCSPLADFDFGDRADRRCGPCRSLRESHRRLRSLMVRRRRRS